MGYSSLGRHGFFKFLCLEFAKSGLLFSDSELTAHCGFFCGKLNRVVPFIGARVARGYLLIRKSSMQGKRGMAISP